MSSALIDFLIDVSEPQNMQQFRRDREGFMSRFDLTEGDKMAVLSGSGGRIRYQSKLINDQTHIPVSHPEFIAGSQALDLVEIEVDVHVDLASNDQTAIEKDFILYDDKTKQLFRAL